MLEKVDEAISIVTLEKPVEELIILGVLIAFIEMFSNRDCVTFVTVYKELAVVRLFNSYLIPVSVMLLNFESLTRVVKLRIPVELRYCYPIMIAFFCIFEKLLLSTTHVEVILAEELTDNWSSL